VMNNEFIVGAEAQKLLNLLVEEVDVAIVVTVTGRKMLTSIIKQENEEVEYRVSAMTAAIMNVIEDMSAEFFGAKTYDSDTLIQISKGILGKIIIASLNVSTILLLAVNQSDFNKNVVLDIIYRLKNIVPSSW
ncbi:MAG: hypothetical protein ACFFC7_31690, partial [Candidatus Hermodarchaeota archaeon]